MDTLRFGTPRLAAALLVASILAASTGCTQPALRSQSPEEFAELAESPVRLVEDVAKPFGNNYVKVESVALVTNLDRTGEDPAPSPQRAEMVREMQTLGVREANKLFASMTTALVLVRAFLPPGAQKGDMVDLELQVPSRSNTTSLRSGWLMETRLRELAVLGNQVRDGHLWAVGQGPVLVEPGKNSGQGRGALLRGRVLGGGTVLRSRSLGLVLASDEKSVRLSAHVGAAINRRFHTFRNGNQQGVATPKTDEFIEIAVHPRYKDNVSRYFRVLRSVSVKETPSELTARLKLLESQLLDPLTAPTAAIRLEAIGKPGVDVLVKGLESSEVEVRFYAAEALAYLDDTRACAPLGAIARDEATFRAYALAALSAMDDPLASERLRALLDVASAETRYGAFRALRAMNEDDPLVRGELLGGQFGYHVVPTTGPAMVHVSRSRRPEVVLFGADQILQAPLSLEAGAAILVNAGADGKVTVSKFTADQPDQKRVVSPRLDDVIRAVVELGGKYPEVVELLQRAKTTRALAGRFEVDALPAAGRELEERATAEAEEPADDSKPAIEVASPLPELFGRRPGSNR